MQLSYPGKTDPQSLMQTVAPASIESVAHYQNGDKSAHNRLYYGDNLPILRALYEDQEVRGNVRLIYIDPPYASKRVFTHRTSLDKHAYDDELGGHEYVEYLRQRLIMLRELLSDDGSIYVHLDSKMAFHIKVIMDEIFGEQNFCNWITRKKCHSKNYTRKQYGSVADYILFYRRGPKTVWNRPYEKENIYTIEQRFPRKDKETGRRFALVPIHAPGVRNGETGKPWRGLLPPEGKHWQVPPAELDRLDAAGEIYWSPSGNPRRKIFADQSRGVAVQDIWTKFMDFRNQNMRATGYPTEKNSDLLRRIISASSNRGDLILDCFCGSGTTMAVANGLGRRWIGIDASPLAIQVSVERLVAGMNSSEPLDQQLSFLDSTDDVGSEDHVAGSFVLLKSRSESSQQLAVPEASLV